MTRRCLGLALLIMAGLPACGHLSATNRPDRARTIQIAETVTPSTLYASLGEEVRWQNLRANPVRVGFLAMTILDELGCEKGVSTFWGGVSDLVTIPAGGSINLCFMRPGELQYNVWFDPDDPKGAISRTASVYVGAGG